jgi:hypothetical protein
MSLTIAELLKYAVLNTSIKNMLNYTQLDFNQLQQHINKTQAGKLSISTFEEYMFVYRMLNSELADSNIVDQELLKKYELYIHQWVFNFIQHELLNE